ncbi:MAG: Phosphoglycolate phosphatase [Marmoricola sp.]|nr:Phosphoglycolate phosphatase [Marmoricola sp.]
MRTPPRSAVIWDMDGTLVETATVVPDAFIETVRRLGGEPPDRDGVVALYAVGTPHVMLGRMLAREGTAEDAEEYHAALAEGASKVAVHEGIPEVLALLRGRGVPLAVFTGNSAQAASILLGAVGLRDVFDVVIGGDEVARAKPAPDGVLAAASALGVDITRCLYVGDSPLDVGAAKAAGAFPVAAGWGHLYDASLDVATAATPAEVPGFLV